MISSRNSGYASVHGLELYYEVHGQGEPLVLLHGGVGGIDMFGPNLEAFARSRQVIAVELQGHGRTRDIDRPLTFEAMADDVSCLLDHLGIESAAWLGYSLGAGVAMQAAIRHPERVERLVVLSQPFLQQGWHPDVLADMSSMGPERGEMVSRSPLAQAYPDVNWPNLFGKLGQLISTEYDWSQDVSNLGMPVLLVFGDADAVKPEHIVAFYRLLSGGLRDAGLDGSGRSPNQLAILPGVTHYTIATASLLPPVVTPFLNADRRS